MKNRSKIFILEFFILVIFCSLNQGLLLGLLWILFHEIAHIITGLIYGMRIYGIKVRVSGVNADIEGIDELEDKKKLIIYIAGPLVNIIGLIILYSVREYFSFKWIETSIYINWGLTIFNLLPVYPLDGARILEVILGKKLLFKKSKNIIIWLSYFVAVILILLYLLTIYIHKANISLLFSAILIIYSTRIEKKNIMYIIMNNIFNKTRRLSRYSYLENKNISVYYKSSLVKAMSLIDKNRYNCFLVLNEGLKILGVVYEHELIEALKKYGNISFNEYLKIKNN